MNTRSLLDRHPIPTLVSAVFVTALAVTAAYWAGLVPGVPKTLPLFVDMVMVTVVLLVFAVLAWVTTVVI